MLLGKGVAPGPNDEDILPLKVGAKVLVTGPTANNMNYLNGGWTWTWQGDDEQYHPDNKQPILEAVQSTLAGTTSYSPGVTINEEVDINAAVQAAADVDVIVACLGESTYTEKPGDITDMRIEQVQINLIDALAETGKPNTRPGKRPRFRSRFPGSKRVGKQGRFRWLRAQKSWCRSDESSCRHRGSPW